MRTVGLWHHAALFDQRTVRQHAGILAEHHGSEDGTDAEGTVAVLEYLDRRREHFDPT